MESEYSGEVQAIVRFLGLRIRDVVYEVRVPEAARGPRSD